MDSLGDQCVVYNLVRVIYVYRQTTKVMEGIQEPTSKLERIVLRIKQMLRLQPSVGANEKRVRRRKALVQLLTRRLTLIKLVSSFPACGYNIQ